MSHRSFSSIYNLAMGSFNFNGLRPQNKPVCNLITILTFIVTLFSLAPSISAETFVSGNITQNTTWTIEGSP
ncbi:MAG: hypothetical protein PVH37_29230, partial [Desulfobacterales bacterium]